MGNVKVDSFWLTRRESITIGDPESGESVSRDFSIGMTVKSDGTVRSDELYKAVNRSLNKIIEEEKDNWMDNYLMSKERDSLKKKLEDNANKVREEGTDSDKSDQGNSTGEGEEVSS